MTRPRRPQPPSDYYDITPKTSPTTFTAAVGVLTARGWRDGETFRMRPSPVGPDEVAIAPIVGGNDQMPGTFSGEWQEGQKAEWFAAARRLAQDLADAGWTAHGSSGTGTWFRRPAGPGPAASPDAAALAAAPPGAPVRLLAIAAELGIGDGDPDEAVYEAANEVAADEYNDGAHPELDDDRAHQAVHGDADGRASTINNEGLAAQLAYLYEGCASEAAFRSLLRDLRE